MPIYYVLYNYGTVASATTAETTAQITAVRGAFNHDDNDHIKFGHGVFRWESTTDITMIAGDISVTTFEKGTWPPPPGRALQVFGPEAQLHVDVTNGTGQGPAIKYVALFIYENTDFALDADAQKLEVTQVLDGGEPASVMNRAVPLQATTQLARGVYRLPAMMKDGATATHFKAVYDGERSRPAPSFDGIIFDEHTWARLPPTVLHAFGSAKKIHDALLGTDSPSLRPKSS